MMMCNELCLPCAYPMDLLDKDGEYNVFYIRIWYGSVRKRDDNSCLQTEIL